MIKHICVSVVLLVSLKILLEIKQRSLLTAPLKQEKSLFDFTLTAIAMFHVIKKIVPPTFRHLV